MLSFACRVGFLSCSFSTFSLLVSVDASPLVSLDSPVPTSSATPNSTPARVSFVADPDGRGTVSLLLSCTLTLILCVWSALHLNVPQPGRGKKYDILLYVRWILMGVFRPEVIVLVAWKQWASAKSLGSIVQDAVRQERKSKDVQAGAPRSSSHWNPHPRRHAWTSIHSLFACSGGFAIEFQDRLEVEQFLPSNCPKKLVLTARGVALLAKCGIVPDVPEAEVWDKSKASSIAKFLVIVQAAWLFIQVIARLAGRLTVTLLEVNTIAHVSVDSSSSSAKNID